MPSWSEIFNYGCVVIVIAVAIGAWRFGGGRRTSEGSSRGQDYSQSITPGDGHGGP